MAGCELKSTACRQKLHVHIHVLTLKSMIVYPRGLKIQDAFLLHMHFSTKTCLNSKSDAGNALL